MTFIEWAREIYDSPFSTFLREDDWAFPIIECFHVLSITIVVGSIAAVDLRLLGVGPRRVAVSRYLSELLPVTWIAFSVAVVSGTLLFISSISKYIINFSFQTKMLLLIFAGLNMLFFHAFTLKKVHLWEKSIAGGNVHGPTPPGAKVAGAISLLLWLAIISFGRWIGFTLSHI